HHLGKAIVKKATDNGLNLPNKPSEVEIMKGQGLRAVLDSKNVYIGNISGALTLGIEVDSMSDAYMLKQQEKGNTAILITLEKEVVGIISIADQIRKEAPEALQELRESGIRHMVMLTGDNKKVAQ